MQNFWMLARSFIKDLWQPILREFSKGADNTKFYADYFPVCFKLLKDNLRATTKRKVIDFFCFSFVGSCPHKFLGQK